MIEESIFRNCYLVDGHPVGGWQIPSSRLPQLGDVKQGVTDTGRCWQQLYTASGWVYMPYHRRLQALSADALLARLGARLSGGKIHIGRQVWTQRLEGSIWWYPDLPFPG